jgi:Flp pilus assembly protein TadG
MMMTSIRNRWLRARLAATALAHDGRGVAAIEFAMLVPIMLVLFFGTVEFSSGVAVNRKVTLMARTFSDLVSQNFSVTSTQLQGFFNADTAIMTPYDSTPTRAVISELYIDPATLNARVQWSFAYGTGATPLGIGTIVTLPSNGALAVSGTYLIYSQISYNFKPAANYGGLMNMVAGVNLSDVAYTRPRQSACVIYPTPVTGPLPACPTTVAPP